MGLEFIWYGMKKWIVGFSLFIVVSFLLFSFLQYSTQPFKTDAIILLVGYDNEAREGEAKRLLHQGYADYLLVPARNKIYRTSKSVGAIDEVPLKNPLFISGSQRWLKVGSLNAPENTHIEIIRAKRIMERLGLKSALFVSSPYHLRRIKMMAKAEFGDNFKMAFVPAYHVKGFDPFWFMDFEQLKWVSMEYSKILWFLLYNSWEQIAPHIPHG